MSAAYVLSAIGLYQAQPGFDAWELTAPMFSSVSIGKRLTISAPHAGLARPYIGEASLNGHPIRKVWLTNGQLRGRLSYAMTAEHSNWGTRAADAPPSLADR
jgi:putative alpha-1,2-mannosidase